MSARHSATALPRRFSRTLLACALLPLGLLAANMATAAPLQAQPAATAADDFGPLKHINAGVLDVAYVEQGPADGPVVILLHGWPYDIHSFEQVAPALAAKGYRVLVPYVRGYGQTRFLSAATPRNAQPSALASDVIAFMDALHVQRAVLAGFDWGARTADIVSALWPERVKALVSVSGYLISSQEAAKAPLPPSAELQWWYQYYFAPSAAKPVMTRTAMRSPS